jgi:integrase
MLTSRQSGCASSQEVNRSSPPSPIRRPAYSDVGWTFAEPDGSVVHPRSFADRFERLIAEAGVRRIVLHGARHTSATLALEAGERADVVAERLGHASVATTLQVYAHATAAAHREAADRLGQVLDG